MRLNVMRLVAIPAVALMAACSRGDKQMDDALKNDLALANQAQPNQVVSPLERGDTTMLSSANNVRAGTTGSTARTVSRAPVRRTTTVRRSSSSGSSRSGVSTGTVYTQSAPDAGQPMTRHTKRDAAIGAAAGAAIGAMTSKDKLKGGVIGAAAGGILGGIIGNNVDVKKHP